MALLNYSASHAGVTVSQKTALQVSAVFACVNVISGSLAMLPINIMRQSERRREIVSGLPLAYALRHEMYPGLPAQNGWQSIIANLVLRGNGYGQIILNGNKQVSGIRPLEAGAMKWDSRLGKWLYHPVDGVKEEFTEAEIFHVRGPSLGGGLGLDAMRIANEIIGLAIALDTNAATFFGNNSRMGTVLEAERSLPPEYRAALEERLKEKHEGPANAHRSLILENGLRFATNRADNNQAQFDESRQRQVEEIARFFGVPPHKIGVQNNIPRANAEEANLAFITDTLGKYATLIENTVNVKLLGKPSIIAGFYTKVNLGALLKGTLADRYKAFAIGRQWGWLSVNDIRETEDLDPVENGDIYLQPVNMVEAGTVPEPEVSTAETEPTTATDE